MPGPPTSQTKIAHRSVRMTPIRLARSFAAGPSLVEYAVLFLVAVAGVLALVR